MKNFDFYEFSALLVPGVALLTGCSYFYPRLAPFLESKERSVGELGFFVVLSFVAGHLVQALSSLIEPLFEKLTGGRPSLSIAQGNCKFLSAAQLDRLKTQVSSKLGLSTDFDASNLKPRAWGGVVAQIYVAVEGAGRAKRVDIFAGNYGLFRGLATAILLILALTLFKQGLRSPEAVVGLALAFLASCVRLRHFSKLYARELFVEFLQLPPSASSPTT